MKIYRGGFTYGRAPLGPHASCVHEVSRYGVHARRVRSQAHTANGSASYFHRRHKGAATEHGLGSQAGVGTSAASYAVLDAGIVRRRGIYSAKCGPLLLLRNGSSGVALSPGIGRARLSHTEKPEPRADRIPLGEASRSRRFEEGARPSRRRGLPPAEKNRAGDGCSPYELLPPIPIALSGSRVP